MVDKDAFIKEHALKVFENPITGNACHVVGYPKDRRVRVNDLDMGCVCEISEKDLGNPKFEVFRDVEVQDFQFSWVIDEYDDDLFERVMVALGVPEHLW